VEGEGGRSAAKRLFETHGEVVGLAVVLVLTLGVVVIGSRVLPGALAAVLALVLLAAIVVYGVGLVISGSGSRRAMLPYGLLKPGLLFMALFFLAPLWSLIRMSMSERRSRFDINPAFTWHVENFSESFREFGGHFGRGFGYAAVATLLTIAIGYPMAYVIAFRGGRYRNLLLGLVVVPFFTSYLIRTLAWQSILADEGPVVSVLDTLGLVGPLESLGIMPNGVFMNTRTAVIGGLTYNFLPFMILPIYVSLEKVDLRLLDAARDLYSSSARAFRRVVLPLSLPGLFAGTLLTFIPAAGDFVNARILGGPTDLMVGNAIENQFLVQNNYPVAAAMSLVLMAIITVGVLIYTALLGTEDLA
jgi:spermidine/putrescine transport system permease protein